MLHETWSQILGDIPTTASDMVAFFVIVIIFRGILSKWLATRISHYLIEPIGRRIWKRVIRTERELAIWLHYKNRAYDRGHHAHDPKYCKDGKCIIV